MDDKARDYDSYNADAFRTLLLRDRELPALLMAHQELSDARAKVADAEPSASRALDDVTHLSKQCVAAQDTEGDSELKELSQLLENPHIRALVGSYVGISTEVPGPSQVIVPPASPVATNGPAVNNTQQVQANVPLKLVGLNKVGNEPLGLMLKQEGEEVKISRILVGMGADRQGLLHVGDVIFEVNGKPVNGSVEVAQKELTETTGTVTMKVIPTYLDQLPVSQVYMRAHFDYDPKHDEDHPFPDGGLAFKRSDVLLIVTQDDPNWWQAKIEGGSENSGLVPTLLLEERRQAQARDPGLPEGQSAGNCITRWRKNKPKPVMYSAKNHADYDRHELNIYEEVARLGPGQRKTVVLIGAQGVGRRGLKQRVIISNPDKYTTTLPHTTRLPRKDEEDGKHYWFTSEQAMLADIAAHKFIEHGTYEGQMYGTKIDSIRAVIRSGKVCLLDVNPQALKRLRTAEFKPFVIFIRAPDFATLKHMHQDAARGSTAHEVGPYSDEDLHRTIHESQQIEEAYTHYFDKVVVNDSIDGTYRKLIEIMRELETMPQWVPINWVF